MSSFLSNIINRHIGAENVLAPKTRGIFEPRQATFGRPNIPSPWLGNEGGSFSNGPNSENRLDEGSMMGEIQNASGKVVDKEGAEKSNPFFSTVLTPVEQMLGKKQPTKLFRDNGHFLQAQKAFAPSQQMQTVQQRLMGRVRLEVPKEENSGTGFFPDVPNLMGTNATGANHLADQLIKPLIKGQANLGKETAPWAQGSEDNSPYYLNRANPKAIGALSQYQHKQRDNVESQPSISPPAIRVNIGRIEIKAVKEAPAKQAKPQMPEKRLTLDEFLKTRDNRLP